MSAVLDEPLSLRQILVTHITRYPQLEVQDLYKLIYQGVFGSEHAIVDAVQARMWLEHEVTGLVAQADEPLVEPISADGRIVRVHLRPYLARGGDLVALLDAFIRTAREHKGTVEQLHRCWQCAEQMAEEGILGWTPNELQHFFAEMKAQGFPSVHHSEIYKRAYRPAYRVLDIDVFVHCVCQDDRKGYPDP